MKDESKVNTPEGCEEISKKIKSEEAISAVESYIPTGIQESGRSNRPSSTEFKPVTFIEFDSMNAGSITLILSSWTHRKFCDPSPISDFGQYDCWNLLAHFVVCSIDSMSGIETKEFDLRNFYFPQYARILNPFYSAANRISGKSYTKHYMEGDFWQQCRSEAWQQKIMVPDINDESYNNYQNYLLLSETDKKHKHSWPYNGAHDYEHELLRQDKMNYHDLVQHIPMQLLIRQVNNIFSTYS